MEEQLHRNPYLDNAKIAMMFLVVFGHLLESSLHEQSSRLVQSFYLLLYLFHVPAWAFLAGLTSKAEGAVFSSLKLLGVFAVFQVMYVLLSPSFRKETPEWMFTPWWVLWFLLSLCFWRLILPAILKLPWPTTITFVIALYAGCAGWIGRPLSLSRTLVWLPVFLAGNLYGKAAITRVRETPSWARLASTGILFIVWLMVWQYPIQSQWLYEADSYAAMGFAPAWLGVAIRAGHFVAAFVLGSAALSLVPKAEGSFTRYGSRTLSILVIHPVLIRVYSHVAGMCGVLRTLPVVVVLAAGVTWLSGLGFLNVCIQRIYAFPRRLVVGKLRVVASQSQ